jgi:hypothetical protein
VNMIHHRPRLASVVMPLVRVLAMADDLSWSNRSEISSAIASSIRHWNDMEAERRNLEQAQCSQQVLHP